MSLPYDGRKPEPPYITDAERLDALEAELAGWKLFADELVSFDPNNEDEIKDAATEIARRFHETKAELNHSKACAQGLQAENERLTLDLTAARFNVITQRERAERAEAELATAHNDALEKAEQECNAFAHRGGGTVGARTCFEIQRAIRALKDKPL